RGRGRPSAGSIPIREWCRLATRRPNGRRAPAAGVDSARNAPRQRVMAKWWGGWPGNRRGSSGRGLRGSVLRPRDSFPPQIKTMIPAQRGIGRITTLRANTLSANREPSQAQLRYTWLSQEQHELAPRTASETPRG